MKVKAMIFIGVVAIVCPQWVSAEEVIVPLPISSPDFPTAFETADFKIELPVEALTRISLHLEGSYQEVIYVDIANPYSTATQPAYLDISLGDNVAVDWVSQENYQFPEGQGAFDFEVVLLNRDSGDWSFLFDSVGRIGIECGPAYIQSYSGQIASAASSWGALTVAEVVLTYDVSVSAGERTWGSLKALFW